VHRPSLIAHNQYSGVAFAAATFAQGLGKLQLSPTAENLSCTRGSVDSMCDWALLGPNKATIGRHGFFKVVMQARSLGLSTVPVVEGNHSRASLTV